VQWSNAERTVLGRSATSTACHLWFHNRYSPLTTHWIRQQITVNIHCILHVLPLLVIGCSYLHKSRNMARQCSSFLLNWTKSEFNVFHNVIDGRVAGPILMIFLIIHTPMMSAGARGYNRGLGAEPPTGVQGQSPGGGQGGEAP